MKLYHYVFQIFLLCQINPFPQIDAFLRLCSRRLLKNNVTKWEIAQNKQFPILPQCFQFDLIIKLSFKRFFHICAKILSKSFNNPFPHIDAFWCLCSRRLFENIVTKEEIAQCFPLSVIGYPFNYRDFLCFNKIYSKSSAAELSYEGKG